MNNIYRLTLEQRQFNLAALVNSIESVLPKEEVTAWKEIFCDIRENTYPSDVGLVLGLLDAPAGKGMHHAYLGGLVVHLLEMIRMSSLLKPVIYNQVLFSCSTVNSQDRTYMVEPCLQDADILRVILLHDLHKAVGTFTVVDDKLAYAKNPQNDYLTVNMQSLCIAGRHFNYLTNKKVIHALECSEGGWAKNPPRSVTPLAKFCYLLDEMSANVISPIMDPRL